MNRIILPGHPEFDLTLSLARPCNWGEVAARYSHYCLLADPTSGILRAAGPQETTEYLLGGEYQERLSVIGNDWEDDCYS